MKNRHLCSEIKDIQRQLTVADKKKMQTLVRFVESHSWSSLLLFRSLYDIKEKDLDDVAAFLASKALGAIEKAYEGTSKPGKLPITRGSEEAELFRERLDELLIAMTFLVFTFDSPALRKTITEIEWDIARRIRWMKRGFLDGVPGEEYLDILERKLADMDEAVRPLFIFLYELVGRASSNRRLTTAPGAHKLREYLESLISEAGRRIEKPDRLFSYAHTLDFISWCSDSCFDIIAHENDEKKVHRFFKKYKWAYPRGRTFNDLNLFWAACMVGVFLLVRALDRCIASGKIKVPSSSKVNSEVSQDYGERSGHDKGLSMAPEKAITGRIQCIPRLSPAT